MTFVLAIGADGGHLFQNGNAYAVIVSVGFDDEHDKSYSIVIGLEPQAGGTQEFYFHIVEADGETGEEVTYWSGKDVARFIDKADRELIRAVLLTETERLLHYVRPERVEVITYDENPPDRALVKYFLIGDAFQRCGYEVHTADPYHGKQVWWMERHSDGGVASEPNGD